MKNVGTFKQLTGLQHKIKGNVLDIDKNMGVQILNAQILLTQAGRRTTMDGSSPRFNVKSYKILCHFEIFSIFSKTKLNLK